ncbi:MAG: YggT family protein [Actinomycetales bacterium]|nr:YggT family protein [Actinomycetales bacterium]
MSITYPLWLIVFLFFITLMIRLVIDWIQVFARDWRPRGPVLVLAEAVYTVTDPPLRLIRRFLPPLRLGSVQLDMAFIVLLLICYILMAVLG